MSDELERRRQHEAELAAEAELKAKMHRHLGWIATVLVLIAVWVALARMEATFGISPLGALGEGLKLMPIILVILGLGALVGLLPVFIGKLADRKQKKEAGK